MSEKNRNIISRRDFLKIGAVYAAGAALTPVPEDILDNISHTDYTPQKDIPSASIPAVSELTHQNLSILNSQPLQFEEVPNEKTNLMAGVVGGLVSAGKEFFQKDDPIDIIGNGTVGFAVGYSTADAFQKSQILVNQNRHLEAAKQLLEPIIILFGSRYIYKTTLDKPVKKVAVKLKTTTENIGQAVNLVERRRINLENEQIYREAKDYLRSSNGKHIEDLTEGNNIIQRWKDSNHLGVLKQEYKHATPERRLVIENEIAERL
jgi:hypothetical protein